MKKIVNLIPILIIITIVFELSNISFATTDEKKSTISINLSEDFKNWNKLSEEEKDNVIMPMATSTNIDEEDKNNANSFLFGVQNLFAKASIPTKYSLTEDINVPVKHQGTTGECWAFSMTSVLESYLASVSYTHLDVYKRQTYISVLERTKEIGILRAIGASKKDISRVFNAETFIVGLIAGILGIVVTLLLNIPINSIIHSLTNMDTVNAVLPVNAAIILVVISMVLTIIAGLIPSRMASKKDPVEALRTE